MPSLITAVVLSAAALFGQHGPPSAAQQKDIQQAQAIVKNCVAHGDFLTKHGRTGIVNCIAPKGHSHAFMTCAQGQLSKAHLLTKSGRANFEQALAVCAEKNR